MMWEVMLEGLVEVMMMIVGGMMIVDGKAMIVVVGKLMLEVIKIVVDYVVVVDAIHYLVARAGLVTVLIVQRQDLLIAVVAIVVVGHACLWSTFHFVSHLEP